MQIFFKKFKKTLFFVVVLLYSVCYYIATKGKGGIEMKDILQRLFEKIMDATVGPIEDIQIKTDSAI